MKCIIEHGGATFAVDISKGIDLSSVLGIPGKEMKAWWADDVKISPVVNGDWIGSVAEGAPVNFFNIRYNDKIAIIHVWCILVFIFTS